MTSSRPFGATLVAFFFLLLAVLALGIATFLLLSPGGNLAFDFLLERIGWPVPLASLLAVPPLLAAGLAAMIFRGLWHMDEWARVAAVLFCFLLALVVLVGALLLRFFSGISTTVLAGSAVAFVALLGMVLYLGRMRPLPQPQSGLPVPDLAPQPAAVLPSAQPAFVERLPSAQPPAGIRPVAPRPVAPHPELAPLPVAAPRPELVPPPVVAPTRTETAALDGATIASQVVVAAPVAETLRSGTASQPEAPRPGAWMLVRQGPQQGQHFPLFPDRYLILGRDPNRSEAILTDPHVSGRHAQVRFEQGRFVIYDLGSTNGTFMGDYRVQRHPLLDGDEIRLGNTLLLFTTASPLPLRS